MSTLTFTFVKWEILFCICKLEQQYSTQFIPSQAACVLKGSTCIAGNKHVQTQQ